MTLTLTKQTNSQHTNMDNLSTPIWVIFQPQKSIKLFFKETHSFSPRSLLLFSCGRKFGKKSNKPFTRMTIYKTSILFLEGQGIPN